MNDDEKGRKEIIDIRDEDTELTVERTKGTPPTEEVHMLPEGVEPEVQITPDESHEGVYVSTNIPGMPTMHMSYEQMHRMRDALNAAKSKFEIADQVEPLLNDQGEWRAKDSK